MENGNNPRLDRIEKIIEEMAKTRRDRNEAMAKAQRERDIKSQKRRVHHKCENRRIDALVRRFVKFSLKDDREHQKRMLLLDEKITQLTAAQLITEEKLQRFLSWRGANGNGRRI
jgi:hypothetical protein